MGELFQCDWCGAIYATREALALVDIDFQDDGTKVFACSNDLPPGQFPASDGDPLADVEPVVKAEAAESWGIMPPLR